MADRKDLAKRVEIAKAADIAVLCLPDAAVKELMAALGDADVCVIDASTAHRVADGWTYGFPELNKAHRAEARWPPSGSAIPAATRPAPSPSCGR